MAQPRHRWDGTPVTEADLRFFALRESGYAGPIDQDGYPAATSQDAPTLWDMAPARQQDTAWAARRHDHRHNSVDRDYQYDDGHSSRPRALLVALVLVVVVMVVITSISHLHGW